MLALLRGVTYTSVALLIVTNKQGVYVLLRSSACATRQPCPCVVVTARRTPVSVRWGQRIVENNRRLCYSLLGSAVSIYSRNRLLLDSRKVYEQPTIFFTLVFRFFLFFFSGPFSHRGKRNQACRFRKFHQRTWQARFSDVIFVGQTQIRLKSFCMKLYYSDIFVM